MHGQTMYAGIARPMCWLNAGVYRSYGQTMYVGMARPLCWLNSGVYRRYGQTMYVGMVRLCMARQCMQVWPDHCAGWMLVYTVGMARLCT
jgi:hypothetical protein